MTRNEINGFIHDLERKYPVAEWSYNGMDIWPLIKVDLFFRLHRTYHKSNSVIARPQTVFKRLSGIVQNTVYAIANYFRLQFHTSSIETIYCGAAAHRSMTTEGFVNRFFYPLIRSKPENSCLELEYGRKSQHKYPDSANILFLDQLYYLFKIRNTFRVFERNFQPAEFDSFYDEIQRHIRISYYEYVKLIRSRMRFIITCSDMFSWIFKTVKPASVYGLCYYSDEMFGMHYAANRLGIANYDMQHGGQGPLHNMYNYSATKDRGYNILPETFLCWDESSAETLRTWTDSTFHKVIVSGNPWIDYVRSMAGKYRLPAGRLILFTLQDTIPEDYIFDAIENSVDTYHWWFKLHPAHTSIQRDIATELAKRKLTGKVFLDENDNIPLPVLLAKACVHISGFSGSILEAAIQQTPTIIIHPLGVENFEPLIQSGQAFSCLTKQAKRLVAAIDTCSLPHVVENNIKIK
ncbi:MAG: hypothetical protein INR69_05080 [Mucilaginibacter polytrichastri]|nr:hypothetical protein [Mucilaginibacter polytrichastri]